VSDYRISRPLLARLTGAYLVLLALVVLVVTAVVVVAGSPDLADLADVLVVVLGVGVLGVLALMWWLRGQAVVRLTESGYEIRFVRSAGVTKARWSDVEDVVAAAPQGVNCVVVRLKDGGTTTVPVQMIAADKDDFAHDVRRHLDAAH